MEIIDNWRITHSGWQTWFSYEPRSRNVIHHMSWSIFMMHWPAIAIYALVGREK